MRSTILQPGEFVKVLPDARLPWLEYAADSGAFAIITVCRYPELEQVPAVDSVGGAVLDSHRGLVMRPGDCVPWPFPGEAAHIRASAIEPRPASVIVPESADRYSLNPWNPPTVRQWRDPPLTTTPLMATMPVSFADGTGNVTLGELPDGATSYTFQPLSLWKGWRSLWEARLILEFQGSGAAPSLEIDGSIVQDVCRTRTLYAACTSTTGGALDIVAEYEGADDFLASMTGCYGGTLNAYYRLTRVPDGGSSFPGLLSSFPRLARLLVGAVTVGSPASQVVVEHPFCVKAPVASWRVSGGVTSYTINENAGGIGGSAAYAERGTDNAVLPNVPAGALFSTALLSGVAQRVGAQRHNINTGGGNILFQLSTDN